MGKNKQLKIVMAIVGLLVMSLGVWFIAGLTTDSEKTDNLSQTAMTNKTIDTSVTQNEGQVTMTLDGLAIYNGMDGQRAYVAVEGVVYDVTDSDKWALGQHYGLLAGQDLTDAFASSPHRQATLEGLPIVGAIIEPSPRVTSSPQEEEVVLEESILPMDTPEIKDTVEAEPSQESTTTLLTSQEVWTLEKLASYNGENGMPAYIAVAGKIYDLSNIGAWSGGTHMGYSAGQDLTSALEASPHSQSILNQGIFIAALGDPLKAVDVPEEVAVLESPALAEAPVPVEAPVLVGTPEQAQVPVEMNLWTLEKLAAYNGENGMDAYIAVEGKIYDVTNLNAWSNGTHKGYSAGKDLTNAFAGSPHALSILNQANYVGDLGEVIVEPAVTTPLIGSESVAEELWTLAKLSDYDGRNNSPAYIAVKGVIYDVSHLGDWSNGTHKGNSAGADLTAAFASSPHSTSILNQAIVVGYLGEVIDQDLIDTSIPSVSTDYDDDEGDDDDYDDEDDEEDEDEEEDDDEDEDEDEEEEDDDEEDEDEEDDEDEDEDED